MVNGKKIDPKPAKCNKDTQRKVFVGGLDPDVTSKEIEEHFSKFGRVEAVETPFDNAKMRRRSYAFVVFSSEYEAKKAASVERQDINGKSVSRLHLFRCFMFYHVILHTSYSCIFF